MKRTQPDETEDEDTSSKRVQRECEARFLIEKRSMGLIIGKGGSRIAAIRESTGVYASILKVKAHAESAQDRVLVLQGTVKQVANAMASVMQTTIESARERSLKEGVELSAETAVARILMDQTQTGAVIGKGGATIKDTQANTGARMRVSKEPMPMSTERTCDIEGTIEEVEAALVLVLEQLKENPVTSSKSTLYAPGAALPQAPQFGADPYGHFMMGSHPGGQRGAPRNFSPYPPQGYSYVHPEAHQYISPIPAAPTAPPPPQGPQSKQQIVIPSSCAGAVIGKGGRRIREIQAASRTTVQISPVDEATPNERVVHVTGTQQGISAAIAMITATVDEDHRTPA